MPVPTASFILTNDNYYSPEANEHYMSVSQFKDFAGTIGHVSCESTALKKHRGIIPQQTSTALLVGSYIDSYFEGTLDQFKAEHPEIIAKTGATKGQLKADYKQAETIIQRIENDLLFRDYMSGEKQVIMTGNLFGIDWKIKMDSYHADDKIVDLKVMKDMNAIWSDRLSRKLDFIRYWGYDIQGAIYQKIVELNTGKRLPFYVACATKEQTCNIEIIEITQRYLDEALEFVEKNIGRVLDIIRGNIQPENCGLCHYCRTEKVLSKPITIDNLIAMLPAYGSRGDDSDTSDYDALSQRHQFAKAVSLFD